MRIAQRKVIIYRNIFAQKNFREVAVNLLYFQKKVRISEIICVSKFPPHTKVYKWERGYPFLKCVPTMLVCRGLLMLLATVFKQFQGDDGA